jgi:prophage DNA circulation protein
MAVFRLDFIEAKQPSYTQNDTASGVLNGIGPVINALKLAYAAGVLLAQHPGFLLQALTAGLSSVAGGMLALPVGTIASVVAAVEGILAAPGDTTATPAAIGAAFDAATAATIAAAPGPPDSSGGLAALAAWSGAVAPVATLTPARQQQAENAAALTALVQGLAVASVAQVYAQTDFASAQDAQAARTQLLGLIDTQSLAAAAAGNGAVYAAWQALAAACSADLIQRAQALPQLAPYATGATLPALVLAYRLYGDITQAAALAALNGAVHPLFLPPSGIWLEPS